MSPGGGHVLIFGIHRTVSWWRYLGANLGWPRCTVLTDLRGEGDVDIVDDFYRALERLRRQSDPSTALLSPAQVEDVIARCRTLRWLDPSLARAMVGAMTIVLDGALERLRPTIVLSFPIDRYVMDILARLADARGVPYVELTASAVPRMSALLRRGQMIETADDASPELVQRTVEELATPAFVPSYVPRTSTYTRARFIRTLAYFRARALAFRVIARARRDPLNLHYLDSQPFLGHKCRWKDISIVGMCDVHWRRRLEQFDPSRRVLFGLQLFPEASIDYWIASAELIDHEDLVVEAARAYSDAGFLVLVKDHPLQFGFRHTGLINRLLTIANVVLIPYEVPGNALLELVDVNFTCTGTLGMQAALLGKVSVATDSYYTTDEDFVLFRRRAEISTLPARSGAGVIRGAALRERQERVVRKLLRGSFPGDFFSFKRFDPTHPTHTALDLAGELGRRLNKLIHEEHR